MNFEDDWRMYGELKDKINLHFKKHPELFQYNQYKDLRIAILKEIMWSYKSIRNNKVKYSFTGKIKMWLKTVILLMNSGNLKIEESLNFFDSSNSRKKSIGIYLDDLSLLNVFEKLIFSLKEEFEVFAFQFYSHNNKLREELKSKEINYYAFCWKGRFIGLSLYNRIRASINSLTGDSVFYNFLLIARANVIGHILISEKLFRVVRPGCLLLNVAEQSSQGFVLSLIAHENKCATINSQNGWKGVDPINQDTNFDKWFIHDEFMKKVLIDSNVPLSQLVVTGHPLDDAIKNYQYSGCLDALIGKKKDVIALFSSFLHDDEQQAVANYFMEYCKSNSDAIVLVRLHPSDTKNKEFYRECGFIVLDHTGTGSKNLFSDSLFDVFSVASISISFGSMISFQSKWFNVPAISVEFQEESILNYIDNKLVWHAKNIGQLVDLLPELLSLNRVKLENADSSSLPVYKKMSNEITALITKHNC